MGGILTIAGKDLRLLLRDKGSLFWVLTFPLIMAALFGSIFAGSGRGIRSPLQVALVDEDASEASRELIQKLEKSESLRLVRKQDSDGREAGPFSLEEARQRIRRGKEAAYLRIKQGYGSQAPFLGVNTEDLEVGMDPSRSVEKGFLQGVLMEATFGGIQDKFRDRDFLRREMQRGMSEIEKEGGIDAVQKGILHSFFKASEAFFDSIDPKVFDVGGFKIEGPAFTSVESESQGKPRSAFDVSFPQAMVWGFLSIASAFSILLVHERQVGTMLRLRLAPLSWGQILAGKALATFAACIAITVLLLAFGILGFGVRVGGILQMILAIVAIAVCFTGFTMMASTLGKTEQGVAGASWAIMMPMAMIGGGMVPLIAMPPWMQTASHFSIVKWSVYSLEGAIWRDFSLGEMLLPCGILVGVGALTFLFGVKVLSRGKD